MDIELSPKSERRLDVQVPSELHELADLSLDNKKPEPELQKTVVSEWYTPDSSLIVSITRRTKLVSLVVCMSKNLNSSQYQVGLVSTSFWLL